MNRREFLLGCAAGGGALAVGIGGGAVAWLAPQTAWAGTTAGSTDTLVIVFLRGAMDGLSLLVPGANSAFRADYEINRSATRVPTSGAGAALALTGTEWALHPRAGGLRDLFQAGNAAFVVAAGQKQPDPVVRSHFEAQQNLEFGRGGGSGDGSGWLTRHLTSANFPASTPLPAASIGNTTATSLLGSRRAITMANGGQFRLDSFSWAWQNDDPTYGQIGAVSSLNGFWGAGATPLQRAGTKALDSLALLQPINFDLYNASSNPDGYQPSSGAHYELVGNSGFAEQLRNVAQLVKRSVGLRAVTINLGNWDTHVSQGNPTQSYDWFGNQADSLSAGLTAFFNDLANATAGDLSQHVSVIVVSEFGRRVLENADGGTDHGYGNVITVVGGSVNGGAIYGDFSGLAPDELYQGTDVAVTTDYRQVLAEAMIRRAGNPNIYYAFPGYSGYSPLGIFAGTDLPPSNYDRIFANGFDA